MPPLAISFLNTFAVSPKLRRRYAQTSKGALERAGVNETKFYLIYRIQRSPKRRRGEGLRQPTVLRFYKTFQIVYSSYKRRQMEWLTMQCWCTLTRVT